MLTLPHRESVAFPQENRSTAKVSAKHQLHATHVVPAGWKQTVWGTLLFILALQLFFVSSPITLLREWTEEKEKRKISSIGGYMEIG